jgi:hypothetical protein
MEDRYFNDLGEDQSSGLEKMREDYLNRKIEQGMADIKAGRFESYNASFLQDIVDKAKVRLIKQASR